jgi:hypothetical protein
MRKSISGLLAAGLLAGAANVKAQEQAAGAAPATGEAERTATYITAEQIDRVTEAEPIGDKTLKVIDLGYENFAVGIVDRGRTVNGRAEQLAEGLELPPPTPCGRQMGEMPEGGYAGGITHSAQAEGYYIISGEGTMFTDGYIVNGQEYDLAELNGPTCLGTAFAVTVNTVKVGDVVVVPGGVVHGWIDVPDHVRYISFRPSPGILEAGWTHPALED